LGGCRFTNIKGLGDDSTRLIYRRPHSITAELVFHGRHPDGLPGLAGIIELSLVLLTHQALHIVWKGSGVRATVR
jgi:hypothetical protein